MLYHGSWQDGERLVLIREYLRCRTMCICCGVRGGAGNDTVRAEMAYPRVGCRTQSQEKLYNAQLIIDNRLPVTSRSSESRGKPGIHRSSLVPRYNEHYSVGGGVQVVVLCTATPEPRHIPKYRPRALRTFLFRGPVIAWKLQALMSSTRLGSSPDIQDKGTRRDARVVVLQFTDLIPSEPEY